MDKGKSNLKTRAEILKEKEGLEDRVIEIKRVSKKTPGGSRLSFSALTVVGDRKGKVGVGLGKAPNVRAAMDRSLKQAKKRMFTFPIVNGTIPFEISFKRGASKVLMKPAPTGAGIIAGGPARAIVDLAGIENVSVKLFGSSNKANSVFVTVAALKLFARAKR